MKSNSSKSSRTAVVAAAAALLVSGCGVSVRVTSDLPPVRDATPQRLGGPYYVLDASLQTTRQYGSKTVMRSQDYDRLHEFCHKRYPKLFARGRTSVPILVRREAVRKSGSVETNVGYFGLLLTAFTINVLPDTSRISETVSVGTETGAWTPPVAFESKIACVLHGLVSWPLRGLFWRASSGWEDRNGEEDVPKDVLDPMTIVCAGRQAVIADAIVHALESMTEDERAALAENGEAWARYYRRHPFTIGELPRVEGRILHNVSATGAGEQIATGRLPRIVSIDVDPVRRTGSLEAGLEGCDPVSAQDWILSGALPDAIRAAFGDRRWNSFRIDAESVSEDGVYTLRFTIVD